MRQLFYRIAVAMMVSLIILLSGCATEHSRLQKGAESFKRQDYFQSFQQLKSLARAGNADAQYAIAFMYYYGEGVHEDMREAREWMFKAAAQQQPLAIKALSLLHWNRI